MQILKYLNIINPPFILTGIINGFTKHMNLRYHYDCELVRCYKKFYFHHSSILGNYIFYLRGWSVSLIINTQTKLVIYIYINLVAVFMLNLYHSKLRSADKISIHSVVTHFQSLIELQPNKVCK